MEKVCVVKIAVSSEKNYFSMDEVVYFRSGMTADFVSRWQWFFEYLAALVKVNNPKRRVVFYKGPQDVLLGEEWHNYRRQSLLLSNKGKLKRLQSSPVESDLFGFNQQDHEAEMQRVADKIEALERDEFPIEEFPKYINKIKNFLNNID